MNSDDPEQKLPKPTRQRDNHALPFHEQVGLGHVGVESRNVTEDHGRSDFTHPTAEEPASQRMTELVDARADKRDSRKEDRMDKRELGVAKEIAEPKIRGVQHDANRREGRQGDADQSERMEEYARERHDFFEKIFGVGQVDA